MIPKRRVSIGEIMILVVVAAVVVRAARSILLREGGPTDFLLSIGSIAPVIALGTARILAWRRKRNGEAEPFLRGFEVAGGLALAIYLGASIFAPLAILGHFKAACWPAIEILAGSTVRGTGWFGLLIEVVAMAYLGGLLLIPAVVGGIWTKVRASKPKDRSSDPSK